MAKKKKGSGKKKKKGKGKSKSEPSAVPAGPTELEISLRLELEQLETQVAAAKRTQREAEEAKRLNEWLREEVQRTEEETKDYDTFMSKKTVQEQSKLLHLTDQSQRQIDAISQEKERRSKVYQESKAALRDTILQRESEIQRVQTQIDELAEFKELREKQNQEIKMIEDRIQALNQEHFESLQQLKSEHLDEKIQFQKQAHQNVSALEEKAQQEALVCLDGHAAKIRSENKQLRKQLLGLIGHNKTLQERERMLTSQHKELIRQDELNLRVMDSTSLKHARSSIRRLSLQTTSPRRSTSLF